MDLCQLFPNGSTDFIELNNPSGLGDKALQATVANSSPISVNKYRNIKTSYNGVIYHSRKEANTAKVLDLMKEAGEIDFWLRQIPFHLPGNTVYRLDFITFKDCKARFVEVKGKKVRLGEIKRAQCEELYGIKIEVI